MSNVVVVEQQQQQQLLTVAAARNRIKQVAGWWISLADYSRPGNIFRMSPTCSPFVLGPQIKIEAIDIIIFAGVCATGELASAPWLDLMRLNQYNSFKISLPSSTEITTVKRASE